MHNRIKMLAVLIVLCGVGLAAGPLSLDPGRVSAAEQLKPKEEPVIIDNIEPEPTAEVDAMWGTAYKIHLGNTNQYVYPTNQSQNIVRTPNGDLHAVWEQGTGSSTYPYRIQYWRSTNGGVTWIDSTTFNGTTTLDQAGYPAIAADAAGNVHIAYNWDNSTSLYEQVWYVRRNAGGTWTTPGRIDGYTVTTLQLYAPSIACTPDGHVHVVTGGYLQSGATYGYGIRYIESTDGGTTWTPWLPLDFNTSGYTRQYVDIAGAPNNGVHVTYRANNNLGYENVNYLERLPGAGSFLAPVQVSYAPYSTTYPEPSIAVNAVTNQPHIVHETNTTSTSSSYRRVVHFHRETGSWSAADTIGGGVGQGYPGYAWKPVIAAGPGGTMHCAWYGYGLSNSQYRVRYRKRTAAGVWEPEEVTHAYVNSEYEPAVFADAGDTAHIVWRLYNSSTGYYDMWYVRGFPPPQNDMGATVLNHEWPYQYISGTDSVWVTVRNNGTLSQAPGVGVEFTATGLSGTSWTDTVYTTTTLLPNATEVVGFPRAAMYSVRGNYVLTARTLLAGDQIPSNDAAVVPTYVYPGIYATFTEAAFPPPGWTVFNFDGGDAWNRTTSYYNTSPAGAYIYYDLPNNDWFITPKIGIDATNDSLIFYARVWSSSSSYNESLQVRFSPTSGTDTTTFAYVASLVFGYSPGTAWRRVAIDLSPLQGQSGWLAFRHTNYNCWGIVVDDIMGPALYTSLNDIACERPWISTYPMVVGGADTVVAKVRNLGRANAAPFYVYYEVDGTLVDSFQVTSLLSHDSLLVSFPVNTAAVGRKAIRIYSDLAGDEDPGNDAGSFSDWVFPAGTWAAQGFDEPHLAAFPPTGWAVLNLDGGAWQWGWYTGTGFEHTGVNFTACRYEGSTRRNDDWLITGPFTPTAALADSVGFFWRCYDGAFPESLEVYAMSGQTGPSDTIARLFAGQTNSMVYLENKVGIDAYDGSPVYIGFHYPSLWQSYVLVDDIWWQSTLPAPAAPMLVYPANNAVRVPTGGNLVWHAANGALTYDVYLDTIDPPTVLFGDDVTDTTFAFSGFIVGKVYYWYVQARNSAGGTNSEQWSFQVGGAPPPGGWSEIAQVPVTPSGKLVKDGGWVAWDALTGKYYVSKGYKTGDFYSYDPVAGTWVTLTTWPMGAEAKGPYKGSVGVSDNNGTIYATKGNNTPGFWKYSATDSLGIWTQLTDVPLGLSNKKVKGGTDMVYVPADSAVYVLKGYKTEFYRYNVNSGTWTTLADAPTGVKNKYDKGSWLAFDETGNKLYAHKAKYMEMYAYSLGDSAAWGPLIPGMPLQNNQTTKSKKAKDGSDAVVLDGIVYSLKGGNTIDFYAFDLVQQTWAERETIPSIGTTGKKKRVKAGSSMATDGTSILALKGNKTAEVWLYNFGGVYGSRPERSGVMSQRTVRSASFALGPNPLASGAATLRYSLPKSGPALVRVYDVTGRAVHSSSLVLGRTGVVDLDLRSLSAGVYLVKLSSEDFTGTQKLVVQH